jgi:hypothetical protein
MKKQAMSVKNVGFICLIQLLRIKERVLDEKKRFPRILLPLILIALLLGGIAFWMMGRKTTLNPT